MPVVAAAFATVVGGHIAPLAAHVVVTVTG